MVKQDYRVNYKKMEKFKEHFQEVDWSAMTITDDVDECMSFFHGKLMEELDKIAPEKLVKASTKQGIEEARMTKGLARCATKHVCCCPEK